MQVKKCKKVKNNSYTLFGEEILHKNVDILSIGKIAELIGNREADMGYITGASLYQNHEICLNHCCEASLTGLWYASLIYNKAQHNVPGLYLLGKSVFSYLLRHARLDRASINYQDQ